MGKKIIIVATGEGYETCPDAGEIWSMNGGYKYHRVDKLFLTDKMFTDYAHPNFDVAELNSLGIPIISRNHIEGLNYEPYPFEKVVSYFKTDYFANSICYMFAYALYKGIKKIDCYGFQFQLPREVVWQKACMEYWIGRAQGMGCGVVIHRDTTLLKHFTGLPYGFDESEYQYKTDKWGALEKWHRIVDKQHWRLFKRWEDLRFENFLK